MHQRALHIVYYGTSSENIWNKSGYTPPIPWSTSWQFYDILHCICQCPFLSHLQGSKNIKWIWLEIHLFTCQLKQTNRQTDSFNDISSEVKLLHLSLDSNTATQKVYGHKRCDRNMSCRNEYIQHFPHPLQLSKLNIISYCPQSRWQCYIFSLKITSTI